MNSKRRAATTDTYRRYSPEPFHRQTITASDNKENACLPAKRRHLGFEQGHGSKVKNFQPNSFIIPLKTSSIINMPLIENTSIGVKDQVAKKENSYVGTIKRKMKEVLKGEHSMKKHAAISFPKDKEEDIDLPCPLSPGSVQFSGRWTRKEHVQFLEGLRLFGRDWKKIEDYVGSRTCAQIRSHAQKYFNRVQREFNTSTPEAIIPTTPLFETCSEQSLMGRQPSLLSVTTRADSQITASSSTEQQLEEIMKTLTRLSSDTTSFKIRSLIFKRDEAIHQFQLRQQVEVVGEKLIEITNEFHDLAVQSFQERNYELTNSIIDERNSTQLICILLASKVFLPQTLAPVPSRLPTPQKLSDLVDISTKASPAQSQTNPNSFITTAQDQFSEQSLQKLRHLAELEKMKLATSVVPK